jgi:hypothetical protein
MFAPTTTPENVGTQDANAKLRCVTLLEPYTTYDELFLLVFHKWYIASVRRNVLGLDDHKEGSPDELKALVMIETEDDENVSSNASNTKKSSHDNKHNKHNVNTKQENQLVSTEPESAEVDADQVVQKTSRDDILHGAIPKIVYDNAIVALNATAAALAPKDAIAVRRQFLAICYEFPATFAQSVADYIVTTCFNDFPTCAAAWSVYARQPMAFRTAGRARSDENDTDHDEDDDIYDILQTQRRLSLERFEAAVANMPSCQDMREEMLAWLTQELASAPVVRRTQYRHDDDDDAYHTARAGKTGCLN